MRPSIRAPGIQTTPATLKSYGSRAIHTEVSFAINTGTHTQHRHTHRDTHTRHRHTHRDTHSHTGTHTVTHTGTHTLNTGTHTGTHTLTHRDTCLCNLYDF